MQWFEEINLSREQILSLIQAGTVLTIGLVLLHFIKKSIYRWLQDSIDRQQMMLVQRVTTYALLAIILSWFLHELGFSLNVLLGAAGILTVALGFASQTSVSNIISGLFLIGEKPFVVGNVIGVDGITGEVLSVDLLSVKLRTYDNLYVRIPNETMLKSKVTNMNKFPIRRLDIKLGVAYKENINKVRDVLFEMTKSIPLCLVEPRPLFIFLGYGDSSLDIQFSVWFKRENFLDLRNSIHQEIKKAFDDNGIEIPFPHRTLYPGSVAEPFPIKIINEDNFSGTT
jgi:small-conductance mechanosensitive channel